MESQQKSVEVDMEVEMEVQWKSVEVDMEVDGNQWRKYCRYES